MNKKAGACPPFSYFPLPEILIGFERSLCRYLQSPPGIVEAGAMAGAVPCLFIIVPCQLTAEMRADGRHGVKRAVRVAVDAVLFPTVLHNAAVPGKNMLRRFFSGQKETAGQAAHGVARGLHQPGERRGGEEACRGVNISEGRMPAEQLRGEDRGSGHGIGHAPLTEACRHMQKRHDRGVRPYIGNAVKRHAILGRPCKFLLCVGKPQPCLPAQQLVAVPQIFSAAVSATAEQQILAALPQTPAVAPRIEVHAVYFGCAGEREQVRALLMKPQGVQPAAVEHRKMRGDDDVLCRDAAAVTKNHVPTDIARRGVLIDGETGQQRGKKTDGVELRLIREADCLAEKCLNRQLLKISLNLFLNQLAF